MNENYWCMKLGLGVLCCISSLVHNHSAFAMVLPDCVAEVELPVVEPPFACAKLQEAKLLPGCQQLFPLVNGAECDSPLEAVSGEFVGCSVPYKDSVCTSIAPNWDGAISFQQLPVGLHRETVLVKDGAGTHEVRLTINVVSKDQPAIAVVNLGSAWPCGCLATEAPLL